MGKQPNGTQQRQIPNNSIGKFQRIKHNYICTG